VTPSFRRSAVAVAATCTLLAAGVAGSWAVAVAGPHVAAASHTVTGGKSTVKLKTRTVAALASHGFALAATGKASLKGTTLSLPVIGGHYNAGKGEVVHTGGFTISKGSNSVTIKNLVVNTTKGSGMAHVTGHGRIIVVAVGQPQRGSGTKHSVTYAGYTVKLSKRLIKVLDTKFSTTLFAIHPELGIGSTTLKFKK
jgi:hypothetical protein